MECIVPRRRDALGVTLLAPSGTLDRSAIGAYDPKKDPSIIAEITGVRDDDRVEKRFRLDQSTELRIYALGEGTGPDMDDFGWIEDAKTGKTVWEMTYRSTQHAGGASKNRRFEGTITLPAGDLHPQGTKRTAPTRSPTGMPILRMIRKPGE